jgi:hypothetical protein
VVIASGGRRSSVVAENGDAIMFVPAASVLNGTAGAADGRISCCGPDACAFPCDWPCEWHGGTALSGASTRQRAKHCAFASASATERKITTLAGVHRMRLQISMHSLQ